MNQYRKKKSYKAIVTEVVNGNTIIANIDLGFGIHYTQELLIKNVYAPLLFEPAGLIAKEALEEKILNKEVFIDVVKDNEQYFVTIFLYSPFVSSPDQGFDENINEWLLKNNYAEYKEMI